jgi:hypothetical protein
MATLKTYQYQGKVIKAYNKEDARRKLGIAFTKMKDIKKIWCKSYKWRLYVEK